MGNDIANVLKDFHFAKFLIGGNILRNIIFLPSMKPSCFFVAGFGQKCYYTTLSKNLRKEFTSA